MRFLVVFVIACGGSSEPTARTGPAASPIATAQSPSDVIVAEVNGRPVWGSCVTARKKAKQAALDECVAFELLAQAADAKGLASDAEVVDGTRAALVNRLIETGFEERYRSPADLRDVIDKHIERNKHRMSLPEGRASAYARFQDKGAAERLAKQLASETGLMPAHLDDAAKQLGVKFEFAETKMFAKTELVASYADALFAIPEVGRTTPTAIQTQWGWDVVLMTAVLPPKTYTRDEAAAEAFSEVRRGYFQVWVNQIIRSLGVKITVDPKKVAKLLEEAT